MAGALLIGGLSGWDSCNGGDSLDGALLMGVLFSCGTVNGRTLSLAGSLVRREIVWPGHCVQGLSDRH